MRPGAATDLVNVGRLRLPTWPMRPGAATDLVNVGRLGRSTWSMRPGPAIDWSVSAAGAADLVNVGRLGRPTWSMTAAGATDLVDVGRLGRSTWSMRPGGGDRLGHCRVSEVETLAPLDGENRETCLLIVRCLPMRLTDAVSEGSMKHDFSVGLFINREHVPFFLYCHKAFVQIEIVQQTLHKV